MIYEHSKRRREAKISKYHMISHIPVSSSFSSLKRSVSELKQSSSAMKNSNLKLRFMSWSISSSWQYLLSMLPNCSVESFDFKNSWISMKQSFSSAF